MDMHFRLHKHPKNDADLLKPSEDNDINNECNMQVFSSVY